MLNEKALFIGPHGENRDFFAKMTAILLEDVIQWRRNFHPNDTRLISESDRREDSFLETSDSIVTAFDRLLGEMKQSVPFHSPRFLGHMHADLAMPALLGYFTGLLYNQNNVVGESSPISTRKEIEFITKMCQMVGYQPFGLLPASRGLHSWGHLCSGGTTANLEAMWVARNLKYYPLSIKLLACCNKEFKSINSVKLTLREETKSFGDITCWELFNLSNGQILTLKADVIKELSKDEKEQDGEKEQTAAKKRFEEAVSNFLVQYLGIAGIHQAIAKQMKEDLQLPVLYVSQAGHYSWEKNLDILGLGKANVCRVGVDEFFRINIDELTEQVNKNQDRAILMIVGVVGTTEEGAIDSVKSLRELMFEGRSFYLHIDGAYGGYFCSMVADSENPEMNQEFDQTYKDILAPIADDLKAVGQTDSIAIDPHKLGYIPYAAGAILFADTRYKDFIYKGAPYLATSAIGVDPIEKTYLGGWTLEGSRPGASAIACAFTAEVVSLDKAGYGPLMAKTIVLTDKLRRTFDNPTDGLKIIPVYRPQTNILCFAVTLPEFIKTPEYINLLTKAIITQLSVTPERVLPDYQFITSSTSLRYENYESVINHIFRQAGIIVDSQQTPVGVEPDFELSFLRTVVMNPMIDECQISVWDSGDKKRQSKELFRAFMATLHRTAYKALPSILLKIIQGRKSNSAPTGRERVKILWIENENVFRKYKEILELDIMPELPAIGKYLDITFYDYTDKLAGLEAITRSQDFDIAVVDLNLDDNKHEEFRSGLAAIDHLCRVNRSVKQIIFSQFMNPGSRLGADVRHHINVTPRYDGVFPQPYQLLGKTGDTERDIFELTKAFFRLLQ